MNLKVAYVPFTADAELNRTTKLLIDGHNKHHKLDRFAPAVVVPGTKALKSVLAFQQLYIVAHGDPGESAVYDTNGAALTVTDLAAQLKDQKLTVGIGKVKLFICNGGSGGVGSTANRLKTALAAAGFTKASVFGYTMTMAADMVYNGHKFGFVSGPDWEDSVVTAKKIRVKF